MILVWKRQLWYDNDNFCLKIFYVVCIHVACRHSQELQVWPIVKVKSKGHLGWWHSRLVFSPRMRNVGYSTQKVVETGSDSYIANSTRGNRCESHVSSEMTIRNGWHVSQSVWHAIEPYCSMVTSVECWSKFAAMGTSPYEWNIFSSGTRTKNHIQSRSRKTVKQNKQQINILSS